MAKKKYDLITDLYAEAVKEVTSSPENWIAFLRSACRNFRLPFDEQILVYAQRPEASAVLPMKTWNEKFGRWVKRDSKGIAVFDKDSPTMRLKYYYDVSDTAEGRYRRLLRPVPLWEVPERYEEDVKETLSNAFGVEEGVAGFAETILEAAKNAAEDNLEDYLPDLLDERKDSYLEEVDEYNITVEVRRLLSASIAYMVMERCGIDTEGYFEPEDFRAITDFNTPEMANLFGTAVSDVSEMALSQVSHTIQQLQKAERRKDRTFAGASAGRYNEGENRGQQTERGVINEDDRIQQAGRLSSSESDRTERTGSTPWEVRFPSQDIPERTEIREIPESDDHRKIEQSSDGIADRSTGEDGSSHERDDENAGRHGRTESKRPNDMGTEDEQHPAGGGRDRDEGTDLHLVAEESEHDSKKVEILPESLEWYDRSKEDRSISSFHKDEDIKALLLTTPHLKATKAEIRNFFETHEDRRIRTEYIKGIFNNEETSITLEDGRLAGYKTYQNVLHMWEGDISNKTAESHYDWGVIAEYFEGMRLLGELTDRAEPLPTVEEQLSLLETRAEEKTSAFSFSQEIIDRAIQSGSGMEHGKYRIYSYFLKNHSRTEKADFLKNEYGFSGRYPLIIGTNIDLQADAKGMHLRRGEDIRNLSWSDVSKRIDELIALERYMTKRELDGIPEYEKEVLARNIYVFFCNQPETFLRPYPFGEDYDKAIKIIRPQLDQPEQVKEILSMMEEVLAGTADYDKQYPSMQATCQDLADYRDGVYSLFSPIPAEREIVQAPPEPVPTQSKEEILAGRLNDFYQSYDWYEYQNNFVDGETQEEVLSRLQSQLHDPQSVPEIYRFLLEAQEEMEDGDEGYSEVSDLIAEIEVLPAMNPPYDLQVDTIVLIGTKEYSIDFISDEIVILRDKVYPLFTEEMKREVFENRVRENPANDHLRITKRTLEETERDRDRESSGTPQKAKEQDDGFIEAQQGQTPFEKKPEEIIEDLTPAWEKQPARQGKSFDLHPEIPREKRNQYHITDDKLGHGTAKEKFRANIMAIQLLKKCEDENRLATPEEQEILALYVGWGGLSDAFDETKSSWGTEYLELKAVLTEEEYAAARQSTLTAFYTPPVVISGIYQALENMGLKSGNILEPSCGTGNFIGRKPESLEDCKVYGVEIDSLSARIAQQLYQKSTIAVQGFETADLPDSFFDVVVGNVPFGNYKVLDKKYDKHNFLIHDYFIAKSIDKTRPKGVLALITSNGASGGTMDKRDDRVRRYIVQRCDLIGAIRLPNNTFLQNAGTEVNTDILFLQKRETPRDLSVEVPYWVETERIYEQEYVDGQGESRKQIVSINPYFQRNPEMILGEQEIVSGPYGPQLICKPYPDRELKDLLAQAVDTIQAEIGEYEVEELVEAVDNSIPADPSVHNFSYALYDGKIYYRENSRMKPVELSLTAQNRVKGMIALRDCARELITYAP